MLRSVVVSSVCGLKCRVCRLWNKITKKLKESRYQIAWLLYSDPKHGSIEKQVGVHLEVLISNALRSLFAVCITL